MFAIVTISMLNFFNHRECECYDSDDLERYEVYNECNKYGLKMFVSSFQLDECHYFIEILYGLKIYESHR